MNTKRARTFLSWFGVSMVLALFTLTITTCILGIAGCEAADKPVADINAVASGARELLDSPAGQMLPPDWRLYGGLATTALMAGTAAYKQWRLSQMAKTTKAIVRGVEASDKPDGTGNPLPLKAAIGKEMRKLGIYDAGNKLVDRLKVS